MTPDDQTHILQQMQRHLVANRGNVMTDALIHGLLAVLGIVTGERTEQKPAQEAQQDDFR